MRDRNAIEAALYVLACGSLIAACATASPQGTSGGQSVATTAGGETPRQEPPQRRCAWRTGDEGMMIVSESDGYAVLLPTNDWRIECDDTRMLFAESPLAMFVSVNAYDPDGDIDHPSYLGEIASNVANQMRQDGLLVPDSHALGIPVGSETVPAMFMAVDLSPSGNALMQYNYRTARQRSDGIVLDFHISTMAPADRDQELVDSTNQAMERATGLFSLLEDLQPPNQ